MKNNYSYSEAVRIAENAVRDIGDAKLKLTAFKTILEDLLKQKPEEKDAKELNCSESSKESLGKENHPTSTLNDYKRKATRFLKMSPDEIDLVYDIKEDGSFRIICDFGRDMGKSSQIQFVFLSVLINYINTNKRKCFSLNITRNMKDYGFGSLPNINAYLRTVKPALIHVNKKKKKSENTFEITDLGIKMISNLVKEIASNGGIIKQRPQSLPTQVNKIREKSNLVINILNLINDGFFNTPKPISTIKKNLEEKGFFYARAIIDEKVRRRFLGRELRRLKQEKIWNYVIKK